MSRFGLNLGQMHEDSVYVYKPLAEFLVNIELCVVSTQCHYFSSMGCRQHNCIQHFNAFNICFVTGFLLHVVDINWV